MFKVPESVRNKYEFVTLAARRAEQLQIGAVPKLESGSTKVTVTAQAEVAQNLIPLVDAAAETGDAEVVEEE
jgi:DNA-directed RNA polymerase omega subunit